MRVKKGDKVKIISGKDRGKEGTILRVIFGGSKVVVDGLNLVKKHKKSQKRGQKGERVTIPAPLDISNVQFICPSCGKPTRISSKEIDGKKVRVCKKCQAEI